MDLPRAYHPRRWSSYLAWGLMGAGIYLAVESLLPPPWQPSARACRGVLHLYQAAGSPLVHFLGVRCRYTPTCSQYAVEAIAHFGTVKGCVLTLGRLFRCSPWGGAGYDPPADPGKSPPENDRHAGAEGAVRGGCLPSFVLGMILILANLLVAVWIFRDGVARGDPNVRFRAALELFFPPWGLFLYLAGRPRGELASCGNCRRRRLVSLVPCPYCGHEPAPAGEESGPRGPGPGRLTGPLPHR